MSGHQGWQEDHSDGRNGIRAEEGLFDSSEKVSKEQVDLRLLEYVSSVDSNLICPICHCPLVQPTRLDCDHIFCRKCLDTARESQPGTSPRCPTCRKRVCDSSSLPIPRILLHILDELPVKCLNAGNGCKFTVKRGEVQDHISLYCDYSAVKCSLETCSLKVPRKYSHRRCLHASIVCQFCNNAMLEHELEDHIEKQCSKRETVCGDCNTAVLHRDLDAHKCVCPEASSSCPASSIGCKFVSKRIDLVIHTSSCPLITLQPFLSSQKDRLDQQEASLKLLQRKADILEGGFASIQAILGNTALVSDTPTLGNPSSLAFANLNDTEAIQEATSMDLSTEHLLSLHESLREEVNRVSAAVSELDARSSLMIMNERLRRKEEMTHTNAAINAVRVQLVHWFNSARMQTQARYASTHGTGASVTSQSAGVSGKSALPAEPVRRSSDSTRQETKL